MAHTHTHTHSSRFVLRQFREQKPLIALTNVVFSKYFSKKSFDWKSLPSDLWPNLKPIYLNKRICLLAFGFLFVSLFWLRWTPTTADTMNLTHWLWHCQQSHTACDHSNGTHSSSKTTKRNTQIKQVHYHRKTKWFSTLFSNERLWQF